MSEKDLTQRTDELASCKQADFILTGDCLETLKTLPDESVDCCVTSPPYYGLRDYGTGKWIGGDPNCPHKGNPFAIRAHINRNCTGGNDVKNQQVYEPFKKICPLCGAIREDKQIGLEETPEEYVQRLVEVFREVKRILKDDGTLWLNIGDSYAAQRSGTHQSAETLSGGKHGYTDDGEIVNRGRYAGYNPTRNAAAIGMKHKDLIGIPWMLAFALRQDGWYLRQDIIWSKPNPMPESVKDRCTKSHEYIFLLSKSQQYYFDHEAIQEEATGYDGRKATATQGSQKYKNADIYADGSRPQTIARGGTQRWKFKNLADKGQTPNTMHERRAEGLPDEVYPVRNKRDVWSIPVMPVKEAHFATFPEKLVEPCILAGCPVGGIVLDPFFGSGTTGRVATRLNRHYIGCELNPKYVEIAERRTDNVQMSLFGLI